ncbi:MAG: hypothetical protein FJX78_06835 [Armatimonadetes bacterium]|nr:hypothetical protein [Armatimonadota bacterium]
MARWPRAGPPTIPISRILPILLIAAVPPIEGHLLKVEGKVARLVRIQINGVEVVRGGAQPIPIRVTQVLRDGDNTMALQFASDPAAAWRVSIERRRAGAPPATLVRYDAAPARPAATSRPTPYNSMSSCRSTRRSTSRTPIVTPSSRSSWPSMRL